MSNTKYDKFRENEDGPTSMNMVARIRQMQKIESDNFHIAKRLLTKKSSMSKKALDKEFRSHRKYVKMIKKMTNIKKYTDNQKKGNQQTSANKDLNSYK